MRSIACLTVHHGYCVDDNARALLLACALNNPGEERLPEALTARLAGFVQHAWNPDTKRFRNFMSFDRRWLEDRGSEDSHGRTLWALGECARSDSSPSRRRWSACLFAEALPAAEAFRSPRAWAFTLLGLDAYCAAVARDSLAGHFRHLLAGRLISLMPAVETKDWVWFEDGLAYDNARLPQALIVTGLSDRSARLRRCRLAILGLAHDDADGTIGLFQAGRLGQLRRQAEAAKGVRSAAFGSHRDNLGLPRRLACGRQSRMAGRRRARIRMVSRQQRSVDAPGRSRNGELPGWAALRPAEREQRRRIHRVLSSQPRGNSSACACQRGSRENRTVSGVARPNFLRAYSNQPSRSGRTVKNRGYCAKNYVPEPSGSLSAPRSGQGCRAPVQASDRTPGSKPRRQDAGEPYRRPGPWARSRDGAQSTRRGS